MKLKINFKDGRNMLVVRLSELAESRYVPKRERISLKIPCKPRKGRRRKEKEGEESGM